jgi:hypothetical protein
LQFISSRKVGLLEETNYSMAKKTIASKAVIAREE